VSLNALRGKFEDRRSLLRVHLDLINTFWDGFDFGLFNSIVRITLDAFVKSLT
jgi:hypothetical protein